ncbi:UPF0287-domain-containing protein [Ramicandelaber brevisporus]|nr:UPF0287-domain-containing protein [Ramicandelaber brevisporus]
MHPNIELHNHSDCLEVILALQQCHSEARVARFFGACNEAKRQLDRCLTKEFLVVRQRNFEKAGERRKRYEETAKTIDEERAKILAAATAANERRRQQETKEQ